jgi:hypothetical protein
VTTDQIIRHRLAAEAATRLRQRLAEAIAAHDGSDEELADWLNNGSGRYVPSTNYGRRAYLAGMIAEYARQLLDELSIIDGPTWTPCQQNLACELAGGHGGACGPVAF